jgi:high-affinity nickel-transport protein
MLESWLELFRCKKLQQRVIVIAALLIAFHVAISIMLLSFADGHPRLLGLALLAYGLGLRHAVDADHIAAIDNMTRKLMQDGQKPAAVGFFFALGHSTIVVAMCVLLTTFTSFINQMLPALKETGAIISALVSCVFLLAIGLINLFVLIDVIRNWRQVVNGGTDIDHTLDVALKSGGLLARILRPVMKLVSNSWNMYWVGMLFGLGFDTASEVALLGISGSTGASGMPMEVLLLIPLSFAAGMALIDTLDGILMLGAYGWALLKPARKLYYNVIITFISVMIALLIGGIEALQIISRHTGAKDLFWEFANRPQLENWGYYVIGLFTLSWIGSMVVYKWRKYDRLESR